MTTKQTASQAVQSYLATVKTTVAQITNPTVPPQPLQIPDYDALYTAAGTLDTAPYPADIVSVTQQLLGRASSVDMKVPPVGYTPVFPDDHHFHPDMGVEWYWVASHLNVVPTGITGNSGRISVLVMMQRQRSVGQAAQAAAGWSDAETQIVISEVTVTLDLDGGPNEIVRRSRNIQWPLVDGSSSAGFSAPGSSFSVQCGPDSITGSANVLPLDVVGRWSEYEYSAEFQH